MSDDSPMSRVARNADPVRPIDARQRAAWTREVEARFGCLRVDDVRDIMAALPAREQNRVHYASPSADRWKLRSTTYSGVATAMATQWGSFTEAVAA